MREERQRGKTIDVVKIEGKLERQCAYMREINMKGKAKEKEVRERNRKRRQESGKMNIQNIDIWGDGQYIDIYTENIKVKQNIDCER